MEEWAKLKVGDKVTYDGKQGTITVRNPYTIGVIVQWDNGKKEKFTYPLFERVEQ